MAATPATASTPTPNSSVCAGSIGRLIQSEATAIMATSTPIASTEITACSTASTVVRSAACSMAARATTAAVARPIAAAQVPIAVQLSPVTMVTAPPSTTPIAQAPITTAHSRRLSSRLRRTGASSSQKPSAAEAMTGPKIRDTLTPTTTTSVRTSQGSRPRAVRQPDVLQPAADC